MQRSDSQRRPDLGRWTRLHWVLLAFAPSSLMLSVTSYLTTDIAAIPLLWVIPLAVYLLTFILVFARRPPLPQAVMSRVFPLLVLLLTIVMLSHATEPVWLLLPLHVLVFFVAAMVCHGELARQRPAPELLTEFYLWLALGGVLGGLFNALVAPLVFPGVAEYPLVLVLACLLRPAAPEAGTADAKRQRQRAAGAASQAAGLRSDVIGALLLGALTAGLVIGVQACGLEHRALSIGFMFGLPGVICYMFLYRPIRFGLGIAALLAAGAFYQGVYGGKTLHQERSFFGIHRVFLDISEARNGREEQHVLVHGNTVHGRQSLVHPGEPLTYFHRTGPIGQVFKVFSGPAAKKHVALVGLGTGSLAAYGEPGQCMTYYEIDPAVERIARDPNYFTFLRDSRARVEVVLGDARLKLREAPDHHYGLMVMDAFSSDAIPLHLLTREALGLYKQKLAGDGLLAFNISNRYLDLEPVLGDLARDAGLLCWVQHDVEVSPAEKAAGKSPSEWVLMARQAKHVGPLARDWRWQPVRGRPHAAVWTDDFSNLFRVFRWN